MPIARRAGVRVPPLPSKNRWRRAASRISPTFAARRQEALQLWLNQVRDCPELWRCDVLRLFLGLRAREVVPTAAPAAPPGYKAAASSASWGVFGERL